jgi:hypothetical protein
VRHAIQEHLSFKPVFAELGQRPPSREAAEFVANAYQHGKCPAWLAAALLGECRDMIGYATVHSIILVAPRQLAESYAGVAMARIAGHSALNDLVTIMSTALDRKSREGAAYGLEVLENPAGLH